MSGLSASHGISLKTYYGTAHALLPHGTECPPYDLPFTIYNILVVQNLLIPECSIHLSKIWSFTGKGIKRQIIQAQGASGGSPQIAQKGAMLST